MGYFAGTDCRSDTLSVTIDNLNATSTPPYEVYSWVYEVSPLTDCATPNGSLSAFVYTTTLDGTFPASVANPPQDTLRTADGYLFDWRITNDATNTSIGTGDVLSNLSNQSYTVDVFENFSGCTTSEALTVSSGLTFPPDPSVVVTHINTCGGTGELSASVGGNTTDYTFEWFDGTGVKPVADFTGAVYTVSDAGSYTVRATEIASSCASNSVTEVVIDNAGAPTASATATSSNTSCDTIGNGAATADGDGLGTVAGFNFTWFLGNNTLAANELPAALTGAAFGAGDHELVNLIGGTYTVVVEDAGTMCTDTVTVDVPEAIVEPSYNFLVNINAGNVLEVTDKAFAEFPQVLAGETAVTVSFWVELSADNYANNHAFFSAGDNAKTVMGMWADETQGVSATITTNNGGAATVNSNFSPVGWVNVAFSWDEATDLLKVFVDGVNVGTITHTGDGGLDDGGPEMYFARDGNLGANKFFGNIDEFRVYHRALTEDDILAAVCDPNAAASGPVLYYDFNDETGVNDEDPVFNKGTLGAAGDGTVQKTGAAAGAIQWVPADYDCPLSTGIPNTSCDPALPNGSLDMTGLVDPVGANYRYDLYDGYQTTGTPTQNTTGIFSPLADGFYTLIVVDEDSGCETDPLQLSIASAPDNPLINTSVVANTNCVGGSGQITATSQVSGTEPSNYTFRLYDGASFCHPFKRTNWGC